MASERVVVVTGGSRGIGAATAVLAGERGYAVCVNYLENRAAAEGIVESITTAGGRGIAVRADVSSEPDVVRLFETVDRELGRATALVNNAGVSPKGNDGARLSTLTSSMEVWHKVFEVNFFSIIWLARGLMDELAAAKGAIVNVTSIAGSRVHPFAGSAYATSKAALAALTREMASDFGRLGIRVNAIAPGEIDTAILSPGTEKIVEQIPMQRLGTTDEVAKIIYVLCTETSSYVNGAEIHINGGQHV